MKFSTAILALVASSAHARPTQLLHGRAITADTPGVRVHPALALLADTTVQIDDIIPEITNFNGNPQDADKLESDANHAIDTLNKGSSLIDTGGDVDYITALGFVPVAPPLVLATYGFVNAVLDNKGNFTKTPQYKARVYQVLERAYRAVQYFQSSLDKVMPTAVTVILRGLYQDIQTKVKAARDAFASDANDPNQPLYIAPDYQSPQYPAAPNAQPIYQPQYAQPQYSQPQYSQPQYSQPQYIPQGSQPQYSPSAGLSTYSQQPGVSQYTPIGGQSYPPAQSP